MKTYCFALAAVFAIGFAGAAYAGDATAAKVMCDSEMDKVTAGNPAQPGTGPAANVRPGGTHKVHFSQEIVHTASAMMMELRSAMTSIRVRELDSESRV